MDLQTKLETLINAAQELGLTIRHEPLGGSGGGLCKLRGQRILFVDTSADPEDRYEALLAALAPLPELEVHYLPPELREDLERLQQSP